MSIDDELTQEEQTALYLQQNPGVESGLWAEWVGVVCGWDKIAPPTTKEWAALKANFHHGKAPIDSVAELKAMRNKDQADCLSDCTPNHLCNGRMAHLPSGEQCDKCGGAV